MPSVDTWTPPDTAAAAIGTFQSTTVLQLWAAYNVIANQGLYVPPRLVEGTVDADGHLTSVESGTPRRVISATTASKVQRALRAVVQQGTGKKWDLPGFPVAAKTGTGRMPSPEKVVKDDDYIWPDGMYHHVTTFAGYLPADRPQVSITVMLFDTAQGLTGSTSAGPVFSDLAKLSIRELSIAPSTEAATQNVAATAVTNDQPVRSAPATAGTAATEQAILPPSGAKTPAKQGGASTRSASASTTIAPSDGSRTSSGTKQGRTSSGTG